MVICCHGKNNPVKKQKERGLKMRKMISVFLAAAMAVSLAGCGQGGGTKDTKEPGTGETKAQAAETLETAEDKTGTVKISYLSRYTNPELPRAKYFMEKLEEFRAANPDILVEDVSIADAESYKSSLKASVAAGSPPTLFICSDAFPHYDWAKNGVIKDLSGIIESPDWTGPNDESVFSSFSFERKGLEGIYGAPNAVIGSPVYVNTKLLGEYGIETPKTWEEVLAMTEKLKETDPSIVPFSVSAKTKADLGRFVSELAIRMNGLEFRERFINHEVKWTDPEMMAVLNKTKEFIDAGVFGRDAISYEVENNITSFGEGKIAMLFTASYYFDLFNSMEFADQIECVNFPYFADKPDNKDIWFGATSEGFCISAEPGTPEFDGAAKLLRFMLSKETFEGYAEVAGGGVYPVDIEYDASGSPNPMKTFMEGYGTRSGVTDIMAAYLDDASVINITNTELQTMFVERPVEDIAKTLDAEYDKLFPK